MKPHEFRRNLEAEYHKTGDTVKFPAAETSEKAHELSAQLKLLISEVTRDLLQEHKNIFSAEQINEIIEHENDLLSIEVYDQQKFVKNRLIDFGYQQAADNIFPDESLMVISLPGPLRKRDLTKIEDPSAEEKMWLKIYEDIVENLWYRCRNFAKQNNILIERINPLGIHSSEDYYYLWAVYPKNRIPLEAKPPSDQILDNN
jgi:hypothetical protein